MVVYAKGTTCYSCGKVISNMRRHVSKERCHSNTKTLMHRRSNSAAPPVTYGGSATFSERLERIKQEQYEARVARRKKA